MCVAVLFIRASKLDTSQMSFSGKRTPAVCPGRGVHPKEGMSYSATQMSLQGTTRSEKPVLKSYVLYKSILERS